MLDQVFSQIATRDSDGRYVLIITGLLGTTLNEREAVNRFNTTMKRQMRGMDIKPSRNITKTDGIWQCGDVRNEDIKVVLAALTESYQRNKFTSVVNEPTIPFVSMKGILGIYHA